VAGIDGDLRNSVSGSIERSYISSGIDLIKIVADEPVSMEFRVRKSDLPFRGFGLFFTATGTSHQQQDASCVKKNLHIFGIEGKINEKIFLFFAMDALNTFVSLCADLRAPLWLLKSDKCKG